MTPVELIIKALHFLLVVFIIGTPFFGDAYLQSMHLLVVPFIMMHWATNQSVCALTELEKLATGKECDDETFFGKVVGPVYKFNTRWDENFFLWTVLIILWLVTLFKLHTTGFAYLKHEVAVLRERFGA